MYCPKCGKEVIEGARFCQSCGEAMPNFREHQIVESEPIRSEQSNYYNNSNPYIYEKPYYQERFATFDANGGKFTPTWNWAAFLFGIFWYLFKGMWAKALIMLLAVFVFAGMPAPVFWIYCGLFGNWDYYLLKRKKTQLWG